jgi:hypothetical protein
VQAEALASSKNENDRFEAAWTRWFAEFCSCRRTAMQRQPLQPERPQRTRQLHATDNSTNASIVGDGSNIQNELGIVAAGNQGCCQSA